MRKQTTSLSLAGIVLLATSAMAQPRAIDTSKSTMTVKAFRAGVLSPLGHDHEIAAPVSGKVDVGGRKVELRVKTGELKVEDTKASDKDRAEIQKTMLGPEVLDVEHNPEILFESTAAERAASGEWTVRGNLTLHGQTQPITLQVRQNGGHYTGGVSLKQTTFSIKPVKIAGGSVRVKDEIRIDFDIQLAPN